MSTHPNDSIDQLFNIDTVLLDTAGSPAVTGLETVSPSRDNIQAEPPTASGTNGCEQEPDTCPAAEHSNGGLRSDDERPQAMLIFVMGEHRFSDPIELGVLSEHPGLLQSITSTQSLASSAFLNPAIQAAMAELRPSLMVQMGVQLTAISFRLVAQVLSTESDSQAVECNTEYQTLSDVVQRELAQALPYFEWQGLTNQFGRVRYLMALLEEALQMLKIEAGTLARGLRSHASARSALRNVARIIADLDYGLSG